MADDPVSAFEQWMLGVHDERKQIDGKPVPLLTTLLYDACDGDQVKFTMVLQAMEKAFDAGRNYILNEGW